MKAMLGWIVWLCLSLVACTGYGEERAGRLHYNQALGLMGKGDWQGAVTALLAARDKAGNDPELNFRSAYNLGIAYMKVGDDAAQGDAPKHDEALSAYGQAVAWLRQATQHRGADADAQANLTLALAKQKALLDELAKDGKALEAKLGQLIDATRALLDGTRQAMAAVEDAGQGHALVAQRELTTLANQARVLGADAGVVSDLAADEISAIGKKAEAERSEAEQLRSVVLRHMDGYLLDARARLAEARRKLQELNASDGERRAGAALAALKRAREQLVDPLAVLRFVAADQAELRQRGEFVVSHQAASAAPLPPWLAPPSLAEAQKLLGERLSEVTSRLEAAAAAPATSTPAATTPPASGAGAPVPLQPNGQPTPQAGGMAPPSNAVAPAQPGTSGAAPSTAAGPTGGAALHVDPQVAEVQAQRAEAEAQRAAIREALPHLQRAITLTQAAASQLQAQTVARAGATQGEVLEAITAAMEAFAGLRPVLELMLADQRTLRQLVADAPAELDAKQRSQRAHAAVARNVQRAARLATLLAHERRSLEAKAKAPAAPGAPAPSGDAASELAQQFTQAEALRVTLLDHVGQMQRALASGEGALPAIEQATTTVEALRRLFFSIPEHLKALIAEQQESADRTSDMAAQDDVGRAARLPGLATRQAEHAALADALAQAMAAQAKQAEGQPQAKQGPPWQQAEEEVRQARGQMGQAQEGLQRGQPTPGKSVDFTPTTEAQAKAITHLKNALTLLEPPPQQPNKPKPDNSQAQDDQGQAGKPGEPTKDPSQDAAKNGQPKKDDKPAAQPQSQGGVGQQVRDAEAQRRKQKFTNHEPVDKDW